MKRINIVENLKNMFKVATLVELLKNVEFKIPIIQNVPLAWTLIEVEIGDEIPEEIYATVAEILVFVYKMKKG